MKRSCPDDRRSAALSSRKLWSFKKFFGSQSPLRPAREQRWSICCFSRLAPRNVGSVRADFGPLSLRFPADNSKNSGHPSCSRGCRGRASLICSRDRFLNCSHANRRNRHAPQAAGRRRGAIGSEKSTAPTAATRSSNGSAPCCARRMAADPVVLSSFPSWR